MENVKLAYLLVAHKCPEQINLFVSQLLEYGDCDIYIHVDKKSPNLMNEIVSKPNIHLFCEYDVRWGSFEIVKAAILLMKKAVESGNEYTHIYFGSGQDLLVKKGLYDYLNNHKSNIFLAIKGEVTNNNRVSSRYRIKWPKSLMIRNDWHLYRFIRIGMQLLCKFGIVVSPNTKSINNDIRFYEGRTWFIAPFEVAKYIVSFIDSNADFVEYWEDSLASDLMFFQTIIMNSPYKDYVKDELMYVKFGRTFGTMNHPIDITIEDDETIEKGNYYCARKFEYSDIRTINYYIEKTL